MVGYVGVHCVDNVALVRFMCSGLYSGFRFVKNLIQRWVIAVFGMAMIWLSW